MSPKIDTRLSVHLVALDREGRPDTALGRLRILDQDPHLAQIAQTLNGDVFAEAVSLNVEDVARMAKQYLETHDTQSVGLNLLFTIMQNIENAYSKPVFVKVLIDHLG